MSVRISSAGIDWTVVPTVVKFDRSGRENWALAEKKRSVTPPPPIFLAIYSQVVFVPNTAWSVGGHSCSFYCIWYISL